MQSRCACLWGARRRLCQCLLVEHPQAAGWHCERSNLLSGGPSPGLSGGGVLRGCSIDKGTSTHKKSGLEKGPCGAASWQVRLIERRPLPASAAWTGQMRPARSRLPQAGHEGTVPQGAPWRIGRRRLVRQGPAAGYRGSEPDKCTATYAARLAARHGSGGLPAARSHWQGCCRASVSRRMRPQARGRLKLSYRTTVGVCCCEFPAPALNNGAYHRCNTNNGAPRSRVDHHRDCARSCAALCSSVSKRRPRRLRGLARRAKAACRTPGST